MGLLTYSQASSFALSQSNLWTVVFSNTDLQILGNGAFPATDVTFSEGEPLLYETELGLGIPVTIYYGRKPPTEVSITFIDNAAESVSKAINSWIKGKGIYDASDSLIETYSERRYAVAPKDMKTTTLTITKYHPTGSVNKTYVFNVLVPTDSTTYQLSEGDDPITLNVSFRIVGSTSA